MTEEKMTYPERMVKKAIAQMESQAQIIPMATLCVQAHVRAGFFGRYPEMKAEYWRAVQRILGGVK